MRKIVIGTLILVIVICIIAFVIENIFYGYINPFGCDYKATFMKGSDNYGNVLLHSPYTYDEFSNFVSKEANYSTRVDNPYQFYTSRDIDSTEVSMLVGKESNGRISYHISLRTSCGIANYLIKQTTDKFIKDLQLPTDLESELLQSYEVHKTINYNGIL